MFTLMVARNVRLMTQRCALNRILSVWATTVHSIWRSVITTTHSLPDTLRSGSYGAAFCREKRKGVMSVQPRGLLTGIMPHHSLAPSFHAQTCVTMFAP